MHTFIHVYLCFFFFFCHSCEKKKKSFLPSSKHLFWKVYEFKPTACKVSLIFPSCFPPVETLASSLLLSFIAPDVTHCLCCMVDYYVEMCRRAVNRCVVCCAVSCRITSVVEGENQTNHDPGGQVASAAVQTSCRTPSSYRLLDGQ